MHRSLTTLHTMGGVMYVSLAAKAFEPLVCTWSTAEVSSYVPSMPDVECSLSDPQWPWLVLLSCSAVGLWSLADAPTICWRCRRRVRRSNIPLLGDIETGEEFVGQVDQEQPCRAILLDWTVSSLPAHRR